jgi:hypothetical protein
LQLLYPVSWNWFLAAMVLQGRSCFPCGRLRSWGILFFLAGLIGGSGRPGVRGRIFDSREEERNGRSSQDRPFTLAFGHRSEGKPTNAPYGHDLTTEDTVEVLTALYGCPRFRRRRRRRDTWVYDRCGEAASLSLASGAADLHVDPAVAGAKRPRPSHNKSHRLYRLLKNFCFVSVGHRRVADPRWMKRFADDVFLVALRALRPFCFLLVVHRL